MKIGTDFSGVGAPEQALKNLGIDFESVFACEIDKYARTTFLANHETQTMYEDITKRDHTEVPQLDLYVAGFPCQSFSIAGKRKGFDEARGTLFFNVAKFIKENQPKCFILENVKGLLSHESGRTMQTILDILSNCGGTVNGQMSLDMFEDGLGYHIYYQVLNTKEHGIPQNRERVFIVGFKESRNFSFPIKEPLKLRLKDMLESDVDEKYYLSNESVDSLILHKQNSKEKGNGFGAKFHNIETDIMSSIKVGGGGCDDLIQATNDIIQLNQSKESGGYQPYQQNRIYDPNGISPTLMAQLGQTQQYKIIEEKGVLQPKVKHQLTGGKWDKTHEQSGRVYDENGISPTIHTMQGGGQEPKTFDINQRIRKLTPRECFRLQNFPDSFNITEVSDTQAYKQAGNSITVRVIQKIIKKTLHL